MNRYQNLAFSSPAGYGDRTAYESRPADEARVREILSALPMELQAYLNETLLPLLNADYAALKSAQGAGGIGAVPPALGYGATVQAILDKLQAEIVNTALGQIPNGGVTREKLAADIRGALYKTAGVADETAQYLLFPATMTPAQKQAVEADPAKLRRIAESALTAPIGSVKTQAFPPEDPAYLPCDGRPVSPQRYPALFQKLGYRYGKRPVTGTFHSRLEQADLRTVLLGKLSTAPNAPQGILVDAEVGKYQWYYQNDLNTVHKRQYPRGIQNGIASFWITDGKGIFLVAHDESFLKRATDVTAENAFQDTSLYLTSAYRGVYYKGKFVISEICGTDKRLHTSVDGLTWSTATVGFATYGFHMMGDTLYALTDRYELKKTTDLIHWETLPPLTYFLQHKGSYFLDWICHEGLYLFVTKQGEPSYPQLFTTRDFVTWTQTRLSVGYANTTVAFLKSGAHLLLHGTGDSLGYLQDLNDSGVFAKPTDIPDSLGCAALGGCSDGAGNAYLSVSSSAAGNPSGIFLAKAGEDFLLPQNDTGYLKME